VSHAAQIESIETSFREPLTEADLVKLRHPTKSHLRALDSHEVLPDTRIWANAYDLVKFSERPGDRPPEVRDHS
jgi:RNA polymerase II-associated factor 1